MATSEHIRKGNAREILQIIWTRMGYSGQPGILESDAERGAEALIIALDAQTLDAMRLQLERDCAVVCHYCRLARNGTDGSAPAVRSAGLRAKSGSAAWRHPVTHKRTGKPGFVRCMANALRERWAAEHAEEPSDA